MSKRSGRMFPRTGSEASLDSTGKQKSFLRTFTRFAEKTSMVGIPYINRAKFWWAKLIWSILLLGAISAMILHLWYLFDQWYAWPKQTSVELGFNTLAFPQVTICNTNKMKRHNLEGWLLKELVKDMDPKNLVSHQFDSNYEPDIRNRSSSRRKRFVDGYDKLNLTKYMYHGNYTNKFELTDDDDYNGEVDKPSLVADIFMWLYMNLTSHARKDLGHQISNMLIRCTFNGRKCNASMFELRQTWKYGNCWTISNKLFQANKSGPTGGLSLVLYLKAGEYLKGFTTGHGIRVQVQKRGEISFPEDEGLYTAPSFETDIALKLNSISRLGGKYGNCNDGKEFSKLYGREYSRRACKQYCLSTKIVRQCGCYDKSIRYEELLVTLNSDIKPCLSKTEVQCQVNTTRQYSNNEITCRCRNPCRIKGVAREVDYTKTVSQRRWPDDEYARVLLDALCDRDALICQTLLENIKDTQGFKNNFLKLNVYYEDMNFQNITESPQITIHQFLSDVGGTIGLWIGLSILSLCELVQLFAELCNYGIHKTIKERRHETERHARRSDRSHIDSNGKQVGEHTAETKMATNQTRAN